MKKLIMLLVISFACIGISQAQTKEEKAQLKAERKAMQARIDSLMFIQAKHSIENNSFVLEADWLVFKHGENLHVTSHTNFVAVNGDEAIVQVAFHPVRSGLNGLGGVTVEGHISKYEIKYDKKGKVRLKMAVNGIGISAEVNLTLTGESNNATVVIYPNFHSQRLTLEGNVVPLENSNVFKGTSL